jgi:glucose-6-phosphate 1-dehydrogenase
MKKEDNLGPTILIIFGGAGDLAWRKLIPALFDLGKDHSSMTHFSVIAVDRTIYSDEDYREHVLKGVKTFSRHGISGEEDWKNFAANIHYIQGDIMNSEVYTTIRSKCEEIEKNGCFNCQFIFYMATPPSMFGIIPAFLKGSGLAQRKERTCLVVEKPIGNDLRSFRELNSSFSDNFRESQIFRIDHYLGKETVQNILAFRFANPLFEPVWNRRYVDYVAITVAESIGIENRGGYYDSAGALRDMVQNHLMQLLCLVAMEPMVSFDANEVRNKKADVLHAIRQIPVRSVGSYVVRGQYGPGEIGGAKVTGYRNEKGVAPDSGTETYVALKLFVDNWRWQDVPFYLRTGKRLARQASEIVVQFRRVPHRSFPEESVTDWQPARIILSIQPDEKIVLRFQAKQPGPGIFLKPVEMLFNYKESFEQPFPEAYETLLWDLMINDATEFMRADQVEAAWQILDPILESWSEGKPGDFPNYPAGSWGPEAADDLLKGEGHSWPVPLIDIKSPNNK